MKRHHLITGKLTALAVARTHERGTYGDGHGLYLQVGPWRLEVLGASLQARRPHPDSRPRPDAHDWPRRGP